MAADLKSREGIRSRTYRELITEDRILKFCRAVGAQPAQGLTAPPTFMTCFRAGEFEIFDALGLKLENVLHAEQQYRYGLDIRAGDEVQFTTTLSHVLEKKGGSGRLCFLTVETEVSATEGSLGSFKTTIVVREKAAS